MREWLYNLWRKLDYWQYYEGGTNSENFLKGGCCGLIFVIAIALIMLFIASLLNVAIYL